jgi:membrane associated rhomboid family serine protease
MRRSPPYTSSFSFGPGSISTAMQALIAANIAMFVLQRIVPSITVWFGLIPALVIHEFRVWQLVTYMFLHGGLFHILFNMLALWMFGTDLERRWGTRFFLKYYFVTGIGAGALTVAFSLLPFDFAQQLQGADIIGASGAIYALLLAYAIYFPERPILLIVFFVPARVCVMILGAIALYSSLGESGGVANATHLGGLLVGYLYLKGGRMTLSPFAEVKYRYVKWRINRLRKKFDVVSGGRSNDWNGRVH